MNMLPELVILTDLDDSLFSTLRKLPESLRGNATLAARAASSSTTGKDSFMTAGQLAMIQWMDLSRCVPVTARGTEAYSRVTLPFSGPSAIVANGAVLLDTDGKVNVDWAKHIRAILNPLQNQLLHLPEVMKTLAAKRSLNIRSWSVMEPSCGAVYTVAKCNDSSDGQGLEELLSDLKAYVATGDSCAADELANNCTEGSSEPWADSWRFHINGNNLSMTPSGISKAKAVTYLLDKLRRDKEIFTIGVGDSVTDLEFMRLCDVWMTPSSSQIDQLLS